ncbi:hypothetical protein SLEP1_g9771 [Rubroshorea leprosula]|uniref:CCHC-type domain-containing protein n=1 Tax=Rubroshorea leprosula TaxID=152421 RepID=A0AAV5I5Y5_9ROSI|nr:hypothetical protein SLEP1_g9771 [Rubroshorea leprosula]
MLIEMLLKSALLINTILLIGDYMHSSDDDFDVSQQVVNRGNPRNTRGRGCGYVKAFGGGYGRGHRENYYEPEGFRLRVDLSTFDDSLDIKGFLDWLSEVDWFFNYMDTSKEKKVKLVAYQLKGGYSASSSKFEDDLAHPTQNISAIDKPTLRNTSKKAIEEAEAYKVSNSNLYARPINGKCYKCNQPGHRSSDCPLHKKVALIGQGDDVNEVLYDPNDDGDYEEDEHGQTYVIRRTMLSPKVEENTQRC